MNEVFTVLWFFVPAAFANMAPIVAARLPYVRNWSARIDFGKTFRGRPLLGTNKTWRGLLSGILVAIFILWLQQLAAVHVDWLAGWLVHIEYATFPTVLLGALFGIGALGGDAAKSFIKRQIGIGAGKPWPVFDQIGEILGSILVTLPFVVFSVSQYLWILVLWVLIDLVVSSLGYLMGWKERPI